MRHWTLHEALTYGQGVERPFLCPVHGDSRPSASVNVVKQAWCCYTCGAKGGLTGEDALIEPDYEVMKVWFEQKLEENRVYPEGWLNQYTTGGVHDYWSSRVGDPAAVHFRLGFDLESDRLTYPLRDQAGRVLGVVRRYCGTADGDAAGQPKYLYPRGVDIGRLLFNYTPEQRQCVVLTEGALDAVAFWRIGVAAFAIYGARLGREQIRLIERVDPEYVVTAFDQDEAGRRAHRDAELAFPHRLVERLHWPRGWGKDVDEIGDDRLKNVVDALASPVVTCVGSSSCNSPRSSKTSHWSTQGPSSSTSRPRRLSIMRNSA